MNNNKTIQFLNGLAIEGDEIISVADMGFIEKIYKNGSIKIIVPGETIIEQQPKENWKLKDKTNHG